jgi:hypothetical protein
MLGHRAGVGARLQQRRHALPLVHQQLRGGGLQPQVLHRGRRQHPGVTLPRAGRGARAGERQKACPLILPDPVLGQQVQQVMLANPPHPGLDPAHLRTVASQHPGGIIEAEPPPGPVAAQRRPQQPPRYRRPCHRVSLPHHSAAAPRPAIARGRRHRRSRRAGRGRPSTPNWPHAVKATRARCRPPMQSRPQCRSSARRFACPGLLSNSGSMSWHRAGMAAYVPGGWPEAVRPPGSEDFEESAMAFLVKFICSTEVVRRAGHWCPVRRAIRLAGEHECRSAGVPAPPY